jgi:hypothetical protein
MDSQWKNIGLELLERDLELYLQKNWSKLSFILFMCFLQCCFTFDTEGTFVAFQLTCSITQKLLNLVNEWEKYFKMFDDKYMLDDGQWMWK